MDTDADPYLNPDLLCTQRRSDRKLAQLLGIVIAREDNISSVVTTDEAHPLNHLGEADREDDNHSDQWHAPAAWSSSPSDDDMGVEDSQPLIDRTVDDDGDVRGKGKTRQRFGGLIPFHRRKAEKSSPPTLFGRMMRPTLVRKSTVGTQNPFADEHAIERDGNTGTGTDCRGASGTTTQDEEMDTHEDGLSPVPSTPSVQSVTFPSLAAHTTSTPSTPKRSPRRRTPGSAKSWRSEASSKSALSTASSLLRKNVRRRARLSVEQESQMRSMRKTVQVLGPEAAGAAVKGTDVSPNKLRFMDFGRQVRGYMRRHI